MKMAAPGQGAAGDYQDELRSPVDTTKPPQTQIDPDFTPIGYLTRNVLDKLALRSGKPAWLRKVRAAHDGQEFRHAHGPHDRQMRVQTEGVQGLDFIDHAALDHRRDPDFGPGIDVVP